MLTVDQKKRKILFVFYEPHMSGISRHIHYLLEALQGDPFEFWLLCSGHDQKIPLSFQDLIPAGNIIMIPPNRFFSLKGLLKTRKILQQHDIDLIHIHNLQSILWGYGGALLAGCKNIIFTPHIDTECAGHGQWFFRKMWRIFNPFTSSLIALSQTQKEWLLQWKIIDENKITIINNHISRKELLKSSSSHNQNALPALLPETIADKFVVTQIGRLDRQKNPFFLIRSAQLLKEQFPDILFVLVGEGPLRAQLEKKIATHNLQKNVILTGHQDCIADLYKISDVISCTSRWEGMPYVLLEAVCFKKAVIATDIPGNRDLLIDGKNSFLVNNEKEFVKRLITLRQSSELKIKMGEAGYQMHKHLFDIYNMKEPMSALYRTGNT
jgi:glycosyltransferase involved in cell wall biosynthesis